MGSRIKEIDGLRGVAVSLVAVSHVYWGTAFKGGWAGVDLFFVLSGYLITTNLLGEHEKTGKIALTHFYWRRAARLMPAAWALLIFAAIAFATIAPSPIAIKAWIGTVLYFENFLYANPHNNLTILAHTWSLSLEEQFYFLWPALFILAIRGGKRTVLWVALGLFAASALACAIMNFTHAPPQRTYAGFDTRSFELFLGCALAVLGTSTPQAQRLARFWPIPALFMIAIAIWMPWKSHIFPLGGYVLVAMASAWLIVAADNPTSLAKALSWSPVAYLGEISYGVYLYHVPLVYMVYGYNWVPAAYRLPTAFIAVGVSTGIAALSYRWLESPIRQFVRDRLAQRDGARSAVGAVTASERVA